MDPRMPAVTARLAALTKSIPLRWRQMRRLQRAVRWWDALRIVARSTHDRSELDVTLSAMARPVRVRVNTSDVACLGKVFVDEEYRLPVDANPAFALSPQLIVDAGANVGFATLFFALRFPAAHIVAIEPEPRNFALLQRNCQGLPNVTLINAALWPSNAPLQLVGDNMDHWDYSFRPAADDASPRVAAVTIADVLAARGAARIDLLKLDIEGAERELFDESSAGWLSSIDAIIVELHDRLAPGCAERFYSRLVGRKFIQEIRGENVFVLLPRTP
jgi:FkbM family methyltransferase